MMAAAESIQARHARIATVLLNISRRARVLATLGVRILKEASVRCSAALNLGSHGSGTAGQGPGGSKRLSRDKSLIYRARARSIRNRGARVIVS